MALNLIHTYLVHPFKGAAEVPQVRGAKIPLRGKLFDVLAEIYNGSDQECDIDISFERNQDGSQQNDCRDLFVKYSSSPTIAHGRDIAERLSKVSTHRSGMGLLFLISGKEGTANKLMVSRFPADTGILADESKKTLNVEFLERVFMKSAKAYKAVTLSSPSLKTGYWFAKATDKQISSRVVQISNYWIRDFLKADFRTTAEMGTRRLAIAMRDAAKKSGDVAIKSEIAAAATLAGGMGNAKTSIREFSDHFGLSGKATEAIVKELPFEALASEPFRFSSAEFSSHIQYRSVELDSGGMLTAHSTEFDAVFDKEVLDEGEQKVRYSTEGRVVSEKLGKSK